VIQRSQLLGYEVDNRTNVLPL